MQRPKSVGMSFLVFFSNEISTNEQTVFFSNEQTVHDVLLVTKGVLCMLEETNDPDANNTLEEENVF